MHSRVFYSYNKQALFLYGNLNPLPFIIEKSCVLYQGGTVLLNTFRKYCTLKAATTWLPQIRLGKSASGLNLG